MKSLLKSLLGSKKFIVAALSGAAFLLGKVGLDVPAQDMIAVVAPLWLFVVSQAFADSGKEKAKIEAASLLAKTRP